MKQIEDIAGSGGGGGKGGGGGSRAAQEAPNTLRSSASVSIVEVISEGEIVGICGGAQGIYLNDTPLMSSTGAYNFARAAWDYRVGLPTQPYMKGFAAATAEITVGTPLSITGGPIIRTTSSDQIDAVKVTILLPGGLFVQNTTNGDMSGTKVTFRIEKKLTSSGSWTSATDFTIDGKTTSPYERQYRIERPVGTGTWDVRVARVSADDASSATHSATTFSRITEIQEVKDVTTEYHNTAVVGLVVDAETVGNQIPVRSYLVQGIKVQVPTNYNPTTRTYTGTWNGTFQTAWTDNPAWVLYDLLTNSRYGMGEFITAAQVDKFSFYDAAVYNDQLVPDGKGGTEPRYTFNAVINAREDAFRIIQTIAGAMRATVIDYNGLITILQDRPSAPVKLVTKANVLNGNFEYKSSGLFDRHTAFNVTFNDKTDRHLQRVVTIDSETQSGAFQTALVYAQAKYGYNPIDIAAFGCTSEGQALRHGRWAVDTEINQTEIVQFKMSLNGFDLLPGEIIKLYDEDYAATVGAGRVVSVVGTTAVLDRAVALTTGSMIDFVLADGTTIESKPIVETAGTHSTITLGSALSQDVLPGADYIVTTTVQPRQFKILSIKQESPNVINLECVYHDPNKFARVELGVNVASPIFSNAVATTCTVPQNLTFRESAVNIDNTIKRSLLISWSQPVKGTVGTYTLMHRVNNGTWVVVGGLKTMSYELVNIKAGTYEVKVVAISSFGNQSDSAVGTYTIETTAGGVSPLNPPTNLVEQNNGTNKFASPDLNFKFINPASNAGVTAATLRDFQVRVIETTGGTVVRTFYVGPVDPGQTQLGTYTYSMNAADTNDYPNRTLQIEVRCRDTSGNLSTAAVTTFTNDPCPLPTNITVTGWLQSTRVLLTLPTEPDFKGLLIWGSTSNGFTPSAANLLYDGSTSYITFNGLNDVTTYYYKFASYDTFGKNADGTGLVVSTQYSATTIAAPGIPKGTSLPSSGSEGDTFFNTTDGKLYRYHGGAWTAAVPAGDITDLIVASQIAGHTITGDKIVAGTITSAEISTGTIVAGNIAAGTITGTQIAADSITATNIDSRGLTIKDAAGTILFGSGTALDFSNIGGSTKPANNATVGATFGVDVSGQITSANASTYIASAAIQAAQIADASITAAKIVDANITSAKIGSLQVDTFHIANNAVSAGTSASGNGATVSTVITVPAGTTMRIAAIVYVDGYSITATADLTAPVYLNINGSQLTMNQQSSGGLGRNGDRGVLYPVSGSYSASVSAGSTDLSVTVYVNTPYTYGTAVYGYVYPTKYLTVIGNMK